MTDVDRCLICGEVILNGLERQQDNLKTENEMARKARKKAAKPHTR